MKKLTINYVTFANGKREQHTVTEIVASTKSQNNLIDAYSLAEKFIIGKPQETEIFVDGNETAKALAATFAEMYSDKEIVAALTAHALKALDAACMFKRNK